MFVFVRIAPQPPGPGWIVFPMQCMHDISLILAPLELGYMHITIHMFSGHGGLEVKCIHYINHIPGLIPDLHVTPLSLSQCFLSVSVLSLSNKGKNNNNLVYDATSAANYHHHNFFSRFRKSHTTPSQQYCQILLLHVRTCLQQRSEALCPQGRRFMITSCDT